MTGDEVKPAGARRIVEARLVAIGCPCNGHIGDYFPFSRKRQLISGFLLRKIVKCVPGVRSGADVDQMRRRAFSLLAGGLFAAGPLGARAQAPDVPIIGVLLAGTTTNYYSIDQLRAVLREAGFRDGDNIALQVRAADGHYERLPGLANELVALPASFPANAATQTIPFVFTIGASPVAFGLIPSLSRPRGNLTGFSNYFGSLGAKRLELLRELVPTAGVIGILVNPSNANAAEHTEGLRAAARALGQPISVAQADSDAEIEAAFAAFARERVGALLISDDPAYIAKAKLLVGLVARYAIPTIYHTSEFTAAGGLISYGARISDGV